MTAPDNPPPPPGPGRDHDDSDLYLAIVGCDVIEPLQEWADRIAAAAPPLNAEQRALVAGIFAGAAHQYMADRERQVRAA